MEKLVRQLQFLRNNHYIRDAIILLSGNGLKIFIGFISNVILAKFFGAEMLGVYGTLMAVSLVCVNFTDFGFGNTLNQLTNRNRDAQKEILTHIFFFKISLLIIFLLIFYFFIDTISQNLTSLAGRHDLIQLLIISIAFESFFKFLLSSLQAKHLFKRYSLLLILNNSFRLAGIIVLYATKFLTLKTIIILYAVSFGMLIFSNSRIWSFSFRFDGSLISKISRYAFWVWMFIIFNTLFVKSDILLINYLGYDKAVIGNYVLIFFFISLISLLQDAIFTQLLPKTSQFRRQSDYQKYYAEIRYIRISAVIVSLIYVMILPIALRLIYANQYQIEYLPILIFGLPFLFSLFNEFNGVLLYAMEQHRYISMANVCGLIFVIVGLFMFPSVATVLHVVLAVAVGKLVVESFVYVKVKQCLRLIPE
jgi:O-antigen/teichoic acid export membrane protein